MSEDHTDETERVRKHMYLVTEHEEEGRVGGVKITDHRMTHPLKNEEGPITVLDEEPGDFRQVGKIVGMGYADFATEQEYEDEIADVMKQKLAEIDEEYLVKAGLEPNEVLPNAA